MAMYYTSGYLHPQTGRQGDTPIDPGTAVNLRRETQSDRQGDTQIDPRLTSISRWERSLHIKNMSNDGCYCHWRRRTANTFIYPHEETGVITDKKKRYEYSTDGERFKQWRINYPVILKMFSTRSEITSTHKPADQDNREEWEKMRSGHFGLDECHSVTAEYRTSMIKEEMLAKNDLKIKTKSESDSSKIYYQEWNGNGLGAQGPASTSLKWKFQSLNPHDTVLLLMTKVRRGTDPSDTRQLWIESRRKEQQASGSDHSTGKWNWETRVASRSYLPALWKIEFQYA
jgi:hypothetical protein